MKARPILFSAPMIRALLDGRKTQTRRVVKDDLWLSLFAGEFDEATGLPWVENPETGYQGPTQCPYGQPGDLLWVRENGWERPERTLRMIREGADTWEPYYYDADGLGPQDHEDFKRWGFKRRPSIHMPRWASRITLRLTDVRVERVHDISNEDAVAEGIGAPTDIRYAAHDEFRPLWNSLNATRGYGWDANPWVWALTFDAIRANVDEVLREAA